MRSIDLFDLFAGFVFVSASFLQVPLTKSDDLLPITLTEIKTLSKHIAKCSQNRCKIRCKTAPGRPQGWLRGHLARLGGPMWPQGPFQEPFWTPNGSQMRPSGLPKPSKSPPKAMSNRAWCTTLLKSCQSRQKPTGSMILKPPKWPFLFCIRLGNLGKTEPGKLFRNFKWLKKSRGWLRFRRFLDQTNRSAVS